jgi:nicotinate-nucleotide--dimethylbenzimidazole phosphoribosyltransferase
MMLEVMGDNKAAVSVLAEVADVYVQIINVGAMVDSKSPNVRNERVASGTQDIRTSDAMSDSVVRAALEVGAQTAERLIAGGSRCLVTGEVCIANTTPLRVSLIIISSSDSEISTVLSVQLLSTTIISYGTYHTCFLIERMQSLICASSL